MNAFCKRLMSAVAALSLLGSAATGPALADEEAEESKTVSSKDTIYPALTPNVLSNLIVAELELQNGHPNAAIASMENVAEEAKSAEVAKRAYMISLLGSDTQKQAELRKLWMNLAEGSEKELVEAFEKVSEGRFSEAEPVFKRFLKEEEEPFVLFQQILASLKGRQVTDVFSFLETLAKPYLSDNASFSIVLCRLAAQGRYKEKANHYAETALEAAPENDGVLLRVAAPLLRVDADSGLHLLGSYLEENPDALAVRALYSQHLLATGKTDAAREQIDLLAQEELTAPQWLQLGGMAENLRDTAKAQNFYEKVLQESEDPKSEIAQKASIRLGILSEKSGQIDNALNWYARVQSGPQYGATRLHEADLLLKTNRPDRAITLLSQAKPETDRDKMAITRALAELLRRTNQTGKAYEAMKKTAREVPDQAEFLYDTAMLAEQAGDMEGLETYLDKVIALKPQFAAAYNALGYSFAERGIRLREALQLVEKANQLKPNDPYILDSLGWVYYRLGDKAQARKHLEASLGLLYHHETVAHLAEVVAAQGDKQKAAGLIEDGLQKTPNSAQLQALKKKLGLP